MNKILMGVDAITTSVLSIGFEGEQNHTQVIFYATTIMNKYPSAVASMAIKSPLGVIYPRVVTQDGNAVTWDVSAGDCATPGSGQFQLTFSVGSGDSAEIIKTYIGNFSVRNSLVGNGDPPDPIEDWLEEAGEALADVQTWENATASAETLAPCSDATVSVTTVGGHKNFGFGIPKGDSGELVVETVTGATPSITGEANHRYICGTVTAITITPPGTGIIDVIFTSGNSAPTLTATGVTFPAWFDATSLQTNKTYEINIADGYGVVTVW